MNHASDYLPSETMLKNSFDSALDRLRDRFSFIFTDDNAFRANKWKIGTWSKNTQRTYVMIHGTESDKKKLPPHTKQNKPHKEKRSFNVQHKKPRKS